MSLDLLCSAGDLSGDQLLAPLVHQLTNHGWRARGLGGDLSQAAGLELSDHLNGVTAHGLLEALGSLPPTLRAYGRLRSLLKGADGLILVDYPEVNMRLLAKAHHAGVPVCYVAPPQAWAWRASRAEVLRRASWMGCLFEFEASWFRARGIEADWIGHPLGTKPNMPLGPDNQMALLPGSRLQTAKRLLPLMLDAATELVRRHSELGFHLGLASTIPRAAIDAILGEYDLPLTVHEGAQDALAVSASAVVGAGTVSLEAALSGRRILVLGRLNPITGLVARKLVNTPWFGLPNLILEREEFPELIQEACVAHRIQDEMESLLGGDQSPGGWLDELYSRTHRPNGMSLMKQRVSEVLGAGESGG